MSHSPCGPNGTKWRRTAPLNRRLGQFELYSQKYTVSPIRGIVDDVAARALFRQNPSRTFPSKDAISRFDSARQQAQSTRWWNASISASSISDFSIRRSNVGIAEVQLASQRIRRVQFSVNAVPVRLHSACLTGNVFRSRRCDCGDQLRLALALLEDLGGGITPYLAQEARRQCRQPPL
jgi:GTP cyclohydrolase II